jgi:putative endonuclease
MKTYFVYILGSQKNGTLYIGVTSDLPRRIYEHQNKITKGFTSKYNVVYLVHVEQFDDICNAIAREKLLKQWNRQWKIDLIESKNPMWDDLSIHLLSVSI